MMWLKILMVYSVVRSQVATATAFQSIRPVRLAPDSIQPMVVGGEDTTIETYPFMCSVRYIGNHICGCTFVNTITVMTAAHCAAFAGVAEVVSVQYGFTKLRPIGNVVRAEKLVVHPEYNGRTLVNDVALIILAKPVRFGTTVQPVIMADEEPDAGKHSTVVGWGLTQIGGDVSVHLQAANITTIDRKKCNDVLSEYFPEDEEPVTEEFICAGHLPGGKGACNGDSGGPLLVDGKQVGIVSWGPVCGDTPTAFTNLPRYTVWVRDNLKEDPPTGVLAEVLLVLLRWVSKLNQIKVNLTN